MRAALVQASNELEEHIDADDGRPNWAMRLKTEIDAALNVAPKPEKVLVIDHIYGVKVGGRFDGWLMRRHPDGEWVTVRRLEAEDPFLHTPEF